MSSQYYYNDQFDDAEEEQPNLNDDISFNLHSSEQVDDICLDYEDEDDEDEDDEDDIMFNGYNTGMEVNDSLRPASSGSSAKRMEAATLMTMMHQSNPASQVDSGYAMINNSHYRDGGNSHKVHTDPYGQIVHPANQSSSAGGGSSMFPMIPSMDYYTKPSVPPPLRTIQYAPAGGISNQHAVIPGYDAIDRHHLTQHSGKPILPYNDPADRHAHHHHHLAPSVPSNFAGRGRGRGGRGSRGRGTATKKSNPAPSVDLNIPRQLNLPTFTKYISLGSEEDKYWLSELQCYLRSNFAEAFGASEKDISAPMHGRNKPVSLGQVGIRCMHCRDDPVMERGQQAVSYPSLISGIYNSVQTMLRMHFDSCLSMPPDIRRKIEQLRRSSSSRGGRKQYWMDSAKRLGMIDTTHGIYFARDPLTTPMPPPITSLSRKGNFKDDTSIDESTTKPKGKKGRKKTDVINKQDLVPAIIASEPEIAPSASMDDDAEPPPPSEPAIPLVFPEDKPLICDYLYLTLEQMQPAKLMQADRVGCYKARDIGFPGLACKHCVGQAGCGRYFPATEASLSQTTTSQTILNHVRNCRRCPIAIRESLELMKRAKLGPDGKKSEKPKHGGRKVFFRRLWCRIQGLPMEEEEDDVHEDDETDNGRKRKSKMQRKPRQKKVAKSSQKKSVADKEDESHSVLSSSVASMSADASSEEDKSSEASSSGEDTSDSSSGSEASDSEESEVEVSNDESSSDSEEAESGDEEEEGIIHAKCGLFKSDDSLFLPDLQCYLRSNMIEVFTLTQEDLDDEDDALLEGMEEGKVGIRCIFCAKNDKPSRGYVHYPMSVNNIYTIANDLQRRHFPGCSNMPETVKQAFKALKTSTLVTKTFNDGSGVDTHQYWIDSAKDLGLTNCSITGTGVVFRRDPSLPSPADVLSVSNSKASKVDLIQPSDKGQITDFTILLMKQVRPCYFTKKDIRKGLPVSKDRQIGFPGIACRWCSNSKEQSDQKSGGAGNSIGRYFPSSAKSLADSTSQSVHAHILACPRCPEDIKTSLTYLSHRSLLQKSELSSGWKRMFYKRVWSRLHDQFSIDVSKKKKKKTKSLKDRPRLNNPYPTFASSAKEPSHPVAADTVSSSQVDTKEDITSEAFESEVGNIVDAAALWLSEHDKFSTPALSVPLVRTRNTAKRNGPSLMGSTNFTVPKSGRGASLPTSKRRRGMEPGNDAE